MSGLNFAKVERIEVFVHNDDGPDYYIGCLEIPDELVYEEACQKLDEYWAEWREEIPVPDTDSEFISWVADVKGWVQADGNYMHTIGE